MLLKWLRARAGHQNVLIGSVYSGLADRVARGDFAPVEGAVDGKENEDAR